MIRRLTVVALGAAALLAACGGSNGPTNAAASPTSVATPTESTATTTSTTVAGDGSGTDRRAQLQAWRDCLSQHGVTLPTFTGGDPGSQGGPPPSDGATPPSGVPNGSTPNGSTPTGSAPAGGPGQGGPGGNIGSIVQDPANAAAVQACASLQPQAGFGTGGQGGGQRGQAMQAYLSCLKDHGVEVPTTVAGGPPVSIDRNAAGFAAANEVCQALLPQRTNGSTTSTVAA